MPTSVIHVFHDDPDSLRTGTRLAGRLAEVATEHGVAVEVFCFGPAQKHLTRSGDEDVDTFNAQIDALLEQGIRVGACVNMARTDGVEDQLRDRGIALHVARDEFLRFTLDGATVITF
ncbi:hypothetical protein L1277_002738 [Okibacterium sp. HSC-33S16]|uniref:DsrE family protein n=1 Tax=Okibacterium sp. HSC-33S16 TaxID=2910965 RepID=UPI0020A02D32|nr:DsrE family protein [Okibacterium sp. HSC-33S16]MCP2032628.1 hypothetical protein [Okibacterium sp. HSC-33S16]